MYEPALGSKEAEKNAIVSADEETLHKKLMEAK